MLGLITEQLSTKIMLMFINEFLWLFGQILYHSMQNVHSHRLSYFADKHFLPYNPLLVILSG